MSTRSKCPIYFPKIWKINLREKLWTSISASNWMIERIKGNIWHHKNYFSFHFPGQSTQRCFCPLQEDQRDQKQFSRVTTLALMFFAQGNKPAFVLFNTYKPVGSPPQPRVLNTPWVSSHLRWWVNKGERFVGYSDPWVTPSYFARNTTLIAAVLWPPYLLFRLDVLGCPVRVDSRARSSAP